MADISWQSSAAGQQWLAGQEAARLKQRQRLLDENKADRAKLDAATPKLKAELDRAAAAEDAARKALAPAIEQRRLAALELSNAVSNCESATSRRLAELRQGLPPESVAVLEAFDEQMGKQFDLERRHAQRSEERPTGRFLAHAVGSVEVEHWNNVESLGQRLLAITAARRFAREDLPLQADVSVSAFSMALAELRQNLPPLVMQKVAVGTAQRAA